MNFVIAIPVLASNAATIALVPPSTDMRASLLRVERASDYCGGWDWSEFEQRSEDDLQLVHNMNISQPVAGDHPPL